tara:strand:+ start:175169 stop:175378 length:210 start_codon:yes stop_codon:yes gene_type:complete
MPGACVPRAPKDRRGERSGPCAPSLGARGAVPCPYRYPLYTGCGVQGCAAHSRREGPASIGVCEALGFL